MPTYICTYTVSVSTALHFLDNEYQIGGKGNVMKVDVSVHCRLLHRLENIGEKHKLAFSRMSLVLFSMKI